MTDRGDYILVDVAEAQLALPELMRAVEERGRRVQIVRDGTAIAELCPAKPKRTLPPVDPRLRVAFAEGYDPVEGLDEDDWPMDLR